MSSSANILTIFIDNNKKKPNIQQHLRQLLVSINENDVKYRAVKSSAVVFDLYLLSHQLGSSLLLSPMISQPTAHSSMKKKFLVSFALQKGKKIIHRITVHASQQAKAEGAGPRVPPRLTWVWVLMRIVYR